MGIQEWLRRNNSSAVVRIIILVLNLLLFRCLLYLLYQITPLPQQGWNWMSTQFHHFNMKIMFLYTQVGGGEDNDVDDDDGVDVSQLGTLGSVYECNKITLRVVNGKDG